MHLHKPITWFEPWGGVRGCGCFNRGRSARDWYGGGPNNFFMGLLSLAASDAQNELYICIYLRSVMYEEPGISI